MRYTEVAPVFHHERCPTLLSCSRCITMKLLEQHYGNAATRKLMHTPALKSAVQSGTICVTPLLPRFDLQVVDPNVCMPYAGPAAERQKAQCRVGQLLAFSCWGCQVVTAW